MIATATIRLPKKVHEWSTAENLREVKHIRSAYMIGPNLIKIEYNARRLSVPDIYKHVKQKQNYRAMITYKVKHIRLVMNVTPQALQKAGIMILLGDEKPQNFVNEALAGNMHLTEGKAYVGGVFTVEHTSEKVFTEGTPIENRRAALDYANNLTRIILDTGEWYEARQLVTAVEAIGFDGLVKRVQEKMNGKSNLFNTVVYALVDGQEIKVATILPPDETLLSNWTEELTHYENQGHDIGGQEPFTSYVEPLGRVVRVLPDVAPLFP